MAVLLKLWAGLEFGLGRHCGTGSAMMSVPVATTQGWVAERPFRVGWRVLINQRLSFCPSGFLLSIQNLNPRGQGVVASVLGQRLLWGTW